MAEVKLTDVTKVYPGGVQAVYSMSLTVKDRELMALVGPSGCGKSTMLRMIAGLETLSGGTMEVGGKIVNDLPPKDRDVAMVFQNYALYPHMTVFENMAFGLKLRKVPKAQIQGAVGEAAKVLGIESLLHRRPKALSGGQRQRVALGRAIVRKPAVFLLDEPLSNLDAKMRVAMRKELTLLHRRLQATMIYVTHDQVEAMTLGQRICVMDQGRIQQVGAPLEIYDRPANQFVAGFIGTPPMNFFDGELAREGDGLHFRNIAMDLRLPSRLGIALERKPPARHVTFGVRPESLRIIRTDAPDAAAFSARVEVVEKLGDEQLIYCNALDMPFVAKADAHEEVTAGETCRFLAEIARSHIFSGDSGENISL